MGKENKSERVDPIADGNKMHGENVKKKSNVRSRATTSNSRDRLEAAEAKRRARVAGDDGVDETQDTTSSKPKTSSKNEAK